MFRSHSQAHTRSRGSSNPIQARGMKRWPKEVAPRAPPTGNELSRPPLPGPQDSHGVTNYAITV